ncbi:MAG: hypothetical protein F6K21_26775 [Symploca sp. SIO2D2]|nr:hypothetical protein [Symploca sp. SIO2D2]
MHNAFIAQGFKCLHHKPERFAEILDQSNPNPDFSIFKDWDLLSDIPASLYYREFMQVFPDLKIILTVRDEDAWWRSILNHYKKLPLKYPTWKDILLPKLGFKRWPGRLGVIDSELKVRVRRMAYGDELPSEFLYKKRFREHNYAVESFVPKEKLLKIDITKGQGWKEICPFLGLPLIDQPFPHSNQKASLAS